MVNNVAAAIISLAILASLITLVRSKKTAMFFDRFDNCPMYHNYTSELRDIKIRYQNGYMVVDYATHVLKDSRGLLEFEWEIQRCASKEKPDSCVLFHKLKTNKFCNIIQSQNDAWSPFMSCVSPKMTCPLKKGVYSGKDCTIDAAAFRFFPLKGAYWKFRARVLERGLIRMCVDVLGYIRESV